MTEVKEITGVTPKEEILRIVQHPDGQFKRRSNEGPLAETNLANDFENRWWLRAPDGFKYAVQLATDKLNPRKDTLTINGEETEVNVLMRIWKTVKDGENNSAICYKLVKDGPLGKERWVVESTTDRPNYDNETKINTWNIQNARYADEAEVQQLVTTLKTFSQT